MIYRLIRLWRRTEAVITGQTRNLLVGFAGSGVRIPPSPFSAICVSGLWSEENQIKAGESMDAQMEAILQGGHFKKLQEEQIAQLRRRYDLKKAELEILYFLSRCGEHNTSTDIHYRLMMNRGHISQAIDSLCKRQFISAIPDENDRRYVHYEILDSAREIVQEMAKGREELERQIFSGISEEERRVFREVSGKIRKNIE